MRSKTDSIMKPRIYIYKITFEEVPYYYYGVHKERKYNEYYMGSPVTHKWCWEFYTPKKQILEVFPFTDEGWLEANLIEDRLIKPFYNTDKWCLNESCGAKISLDSRRRGGKTQSKNNMNLGVGFYGMSREEKFNASRKGGITQGNIAKELNIGIFSPDYESKRKINCSKAGKNGSAKNKENKVGIFSLSKTDLSINGKKGGAKASKNTNSQKWMCTETGYITTSGPLTKYQRKRGIDVSSRKRIN
jgi:hypothetical protein